MEPDRFQYNNKLYIVGIISLILALSLFFFSLYILPYLLWGFYYEVPDTVTVLTTYFEKKYRFSSPQSRFFVWLIFFIPSLITGYIAYYISNHIDNQIYKITPPENEEEKTPASQKINQEIRESAGLAAKIIILMIAIVAIVLLLQLFVLS